MFNVSELRAVGTLAVDGVAVRFMDELLPSAGRLGEKAQAWLGPGLRHSTDFGRATTAETKVAGALVPNPPSVNWHEVEAAPGSGGQTLSGFANPFDTDRTHKPIPSDLGFLRGRAEFPPFLGRDEGSRSVIDGEPIFRAAQARAIRGSAAKAYEVVRSVDPVSIDAAMGDFNRVTEAKTAGVALTRRDLQWTTQRPDGRGPGNPVFDAITEHRDAFRGVFSEFHDRAYIQGKEAVGELHVRSGAGELNVLRKLVGDGVVDNNQRVRRYLNRYNAVGHFKVLSEDVIDSGRFERAFSLPDGKIANLPERSVVLNSMYNNWDSLAREVNSKYRPSIRSDQTHYMEDLQALGMANFLTVLRHGEMNLRVATLDEFLNHMNAAASLDAPHDAFAKLPYDHPMVKHAMKLDWQVIKSGVHIFDRSQQYEELLRAGRARFE